MIVNGEMERLWKEEVMAQFKILSWHSHKDTEKNHRNVNQNDQYPRRVSSQAPAEYKYKMLWFGATCSVFQNTLHLLTKNKWGTVLCPF
jgi:hypothetical protein